MLPLNPRRHHHERCRLTRAQLSAYLDGELGDERAAVERHLRWCPSCRRMLGNLSRTVTALRRLGQQTPPAE